MTLPWQTEQWRQLWRAKQDNRLPHALLLTGITGIGKRDFAANLARSLLCQLVSADGVACHQCHACRLVAGDVHPNIMLLVPEKEGQAIKIDQIRAVNEFISQSSFQGDYKVVIIHPANQMNLSAANALLKTLEEPSSGSLMILVSDQREGLPATILSRCQTLLFARPSLLQAMTWLNEKIAQEKNKLEDGMSPELLLRLANGAPLAALRLMQEDSLEARQQLLQALCAVSAERQPADPVQLAAKTQTLEPIQQLDCMLSWVMDLLRLQMQGGTDSITNQDFEKQLMALSRRTRVEANIGLMNYLQKLRGQIARGLNLNKQLLIESVFIRWSAMTCS